MKLLYRLFHRGKEITIKKEKINRIDKLKLY